jgi:hypothetical protein
MPTVRQSEFARQHGVTRNAVLKWKNRGWLVMDGDLVDVEASNANLKKYRRTAAPSAARAEHKAERIGCSAAPHSLPEALRLKENSLAKLHQLEYEKRSTEVVLVADAEQVSKEIFDRVRGRLLAIPAQCARTVHGSKTVPEAQEAIRAAVTSALEDLAGPTTD